MEAELPIILGTVFGSSWASLCRGRWSLAWDCNRTGTMRQCHSGPAGGTAGSAGAVPRHFAGRELFSLKKFCARFLPKRNGFCGTFD